MDLKQAKKDIEELNKELLEMETIKQLRDSLVKYVAAKENKTKSPSSIHLVETVRHKGAATSDFEESNTDLVKRAVEAMNGQPFGVADIHAHLISVGKEISKLDISSVLSRSKGKWVDVVEKGKGSQPSVYRKAA